MQDTWDTVVLIQEIKKFGSRFTETSVEHTHFQVRNTAWAIFTVSYSYLGVRYCTSIARATYGFAYIYVQYCVPVVSTYVVRGGAPFGREAVAAGMYTGIYSPAVLEPSFATTKWRSAVSPTFCYYELGHRVSIMLRKRRATLLLLQCSSGTRLRVHVFSILSSRPSAPGAYATSKYTINIMTRACGRY